jgi:hypothetical protein
VAKYHNQLIRLYLGKSDFTPNQFAELTAKLPNAHDREQLLWTFFTQNEKYQSSVLESFLYAVTRDAAEWPLELFVKMVRRSQAFLKDEFADALQRESLPGSFRHHQIGWRELRKEELKLWRKVEDALRDIETSDPAITPETVVANMTCWLDRECYAYSDQTSIAGTVGRVARVYSFFVPLYFSKPRAIEEEALKESVIQAAVIPNDLCVELAKAINDYLHFYDGTISIYSYDDNFGPSDDGGNVGYYDLEALTDWYQDGLRPLLIEEAYEQQGNRMACELQKGTKGTSRVVDPKLCAIRLLVEDSECEEICHYGASIPTVVCAEQLNAYSDYATTRYVRPMVEAARQQSGFAPMVQLTLEKTYEKYGDETLPLLTDTEAAFKQKFDQEQRQVGLGQFILHKFTYAPSRKKKVAESFDRFRSVYNVMLTPFVCVDRTVFCPTTLLAHNNWMFSIVEVALRSYRKGGAGKEKGRQSAWAMESRLGETFIAAGFTVKVIDPKDIPNDAGDVDIIVTDGKADLLIQLKRTQVRATLKEAYFEQQNSDHKAAEQLQKVERFLAVDNHVHSLKSNYRKWVVSTSFEHLGELTPGITKVNYYELLWTLRTAYGQGEPTSLEKLCEAVGRF